MLKADLRIPEKEEQWRIEVGQAIDRVRRKAGLTIQEFANRVDRDEAQVRRWINGKEHAQLAVLFAVPAFRALTVIALAEIDGSGVELETVARVKHA